MWVHIRCGEARSARARIRSLRAELACELRSLPRDHGVGRNPCPMPRHDATNATATRAMYTVLKKAGSEQSWLVQKTSTITQMRAHTRHTLGRCWHVRGRSHGVCKLRTLACPHPRLQQTPRLGCPLQTRCCGQASRMHTTSCASAPGNAHITSDCDGLVQTCVWAALGQATHSVC